VTERTITDLEGLIAACDRALEVLRDPDLPGPPDLVLLAHIERIRADTAIELERI
jgi:hypothetical protein